MERIVVAFPGEETRRRFLTLLAAEGWEALPCATGAEALRMVRQMESAAVVCGFYLGDMSADRLAADLRGLAAVLVVAKADRLELCGGENLYKLAAPLSRPEFFATLRLMLDAARPRSGVSRRNEEERRLIRRAKELLMDVNRMSEEEAHRFLRRRAMDGGVKLAEAARRVIDSYTI